jgi:hypothetical protein
MNNALIGISNITGGLTVGTVVMFAVTFGIAAVVLTLVVHWRIAAKAGYPGALSLLMLIPLANVVVMLVFAFSKWPIEEELEAAYAARRPTLPPPML